jgi:ubiquinone biosynthesis protein UbiJ
MNFTTKIAALAALAVMAGCTDLKPLQAQVDDLKSQVGKLSSDVAANKAAADTSSKSAAAAAAAASQSAAAAQNTANQALAAAKAAQSGVDALNEKIDRMFKRSVSK